jgi:uncharacterized protein
VNFQLTDHNFGQKFGLSDQMYIKEVTSIQKVSFSEGKFYKDVSFQKGRMKELLKTIIRNFHTRELPNAIERDIKVPLNSGKVVTIIGSRRAGKTFLLYQLMSKLKKKEQIVYINFEDERLDLKVKDLQLIIDSYLELYPHVKEKDIYFFFDEIQEIDGWEKFVRRVYDQISQKIFITGSSAKLLSKEIATSLRGRTITYELYPLSFAEYLDFKKHTPDIHSTKGKAALISLFDKYLQHGGFPETAKMTQELRDKTLKNYYEVMLYRDVVDRYKVTNVLALKMLLKKTIANTARDISINKIFNEFKSQGVKVSKDSLYKYVDYCEDAYLLFVLRQFSESLAKQIPKKAYVIDPGLSSQLSFSLSKDYGRLLENIIFLELKRRGHDVFLFRNGVECDFIIKSKDKITSAIQVCYSLNPENKDREFAGLQKAMERFSLRRGIIITHGQEEIVENISVIPVWKWLLETRKTTK